MILREIQFVHDLYGFRLRLEALEGHREMLCLYLLGTGKPPEKIHMPEGTAILTVCDSLKAYFFFLLYQAADLFVLYFGQFLCGKAAGLELSSGIVDGSCAQEAADNIITVGSGIFHGMCPF